LFHKVLTSLFDIKNKKIRIYVYNSSEEKIKIPLKEVRVNNYIDKRATRPYYIWRLASRELNKKWKKHVERIINNKELYVEVLRGFFAGEGNIKTGSHSNRTIRISQGKPSTLIETILDRLNVNYRFSIGERNYVITGKSNWEIFAKLKITDLHPEKKLRFWEAFNEFKEEHYEKNYLRDNIFNLLASPQTTKELALRFNRSQARIYDVLELLKKSSKIDNFRVRSKDYWIRMDQKVIIISKIKYKYLEFLDNVEKTTKEVSEIFNVDWKSSFARLRELEKLGMVIRTKNKSWRRLSMDKKVIPL
jgi:hypothetical protein|tara:strand:- start:838 stop:1752 length:915 start_codon:yes stop_codon:yes gene_type:complete